MNGFSRTRNVSPIPPATDSVSSCTSSKYPVEPGDSAVVAVTGYFGLRLAEMARRAGADVRTVEVDPGEIVDPAAVAAELEKRPAKVLAFVHVETTTGACQPIQPMVDVAKRYGALVVMDCVTSLAGIPIDIDASGVDAAGSCSQKSPSSDTWYLAPPLGKCVR